MKISIIKNLLKGTAAISAAVVSFLVLTSVSYAAGVAPLVTAQKYMDSNGDGTVDQVRITFDQVITVCTATADDFTYTGQSIGGTLGAVSCTGGDLIVDIALTGANANVTSSASAPTLSYTDDVARGISNEALLEVANFAAGALADGAAPVPILIKIMDINGASNGKQDTIKVTFTENIDDSVIENYNCPGTGTYIPTNLAIPGAIGDSVVCPGVIVGDGEDDEVLYLRIDELAGTCSYADQSSCDGGGANKDVTWTGGAGNIAIADKAATPNYAATLLSGGFTETDASIPVYLGAATIDSDANGKVDQLIMKFSENIDDSGIAGYSCAGASYVATSLAVANVTGEEMLCPSGGDMEDDVTLTITIAEDASACSATDQTGCDTDAIDQNVSFTGMSITILDMAGNNASDLAATAPADGAAPVLIAAITQDLDYTGEVDHLKLIFSESIDDSSIANYSAVANYTPTSLAVANVTSEAVDFDADAEDNDIIYIIFTEDSNTCDSTDQTGCDTEAVDQDITWTGSSALFQDTTGNDVLDLDSVGITEADGSAPVLMAVVAGTSSGANTLAFTYSEAVTITDGASSATCGDLTIAGNLVGLGTFATAGNLTVATTKNTVAGNGTDTITVTLAGQTGGYLISTGAAAITVPSGTVTGHGAAGVVDASSNQVTPSGSAVTATTLPGAVWDVTPPTVTAATLQDLSGSDSVPDTLAITASETLKTITDASTTRDDWGITSTAGTFGASLAVSAASASGTAYTITFSGANQTYNDAGQFDLLNTQDTAPSFVDLAGNPIASGLTAQTYQICYTGYSCTGGTIANTALITNSLSARPVTPTGGGVILPSSSSRRSRSTTTETTTTEEDAEEEEEETTTEATTTEDDAEEETITDTTTTDTATTDTATTDTATTDTTTTTDTTPTYTPQTYYYQAPSEATTPTISTYHETQYENFTQNSIQADTDNDGIEDAFETGMGTDILNADTDGDGLSDYEELDLGTSATSLDTDGDGVSDKIEQLLGTDPTVKASRPTDLTKDTDSDGTPDFIEKAYGMDPTSADTDGDGDPDSNELFFGTDPLNKDDRTVEHPQITYFSNTKVSSGKTILLPIRTPPNEEATVKWINKKGEVVKSVVVAQTNEFGQAVVELEVPENAKDEDEEFYIVVENGQEGQMKKFIVTKDETPSIEIVNIVGTIEVTQADDSKLNWANEYFKGEGYYQKYIKNTSYAEMLASKIAELKNMPTVITLKINDADLMTQLHSIFQSAIFTSVIITDKDEVQITVPQNLEAGTHRGYFMLFNKHQNILSPVFELIFNKPSTSPTV